MLLRRAQYRVSEQILCRLRAISLRRRFRRVSGCFSGRVRNYGENAAIQSAVDALNISLRQLKGAAELDVVRGIEGDAAARYFGVFGQLLSEKSGFSFDGQQPPPAQRRG